MKRGAELNARGHTTVVVHQALEKPSPLGIHRHGIFEIPGVELFDENEAQTVRKRSEVHREWVPFLPELPGFHQVSSRAGVAGRAGGDGSREISSATPERAFA